MSVCPSIGGGNFVTWVKWFLWEFSSVKIRIFI